MKSYLIAGVTALFLLTGCGNLFDPAAAVVDGTKITMSDIQEELDRFRATARYEQLIAQASEGEIERDFQQTYLSLLIREAVFESEAEERGIDVTPEEINERIGDIKAEIGSEGQFQEALKEQGLTLEQAEFQVRVQLLAEKLRTEVTKGVGPSEEEMRAYYEEHAEDFQEVRPQHILLSEDERSLAQDLAERLQSAKPNEVDDLFASLAKKYSEDPSADEEGDLGWAPPAQYVGPFREVVTELEVGVVSDPVQTEFGWHVIRVVGRRVTPFEEARTQIQEAIGAEAIDEAWQQWLVDAYREADIKVNERFGTLDPETGAVENPTAEDVPGGEAPGSASPSPSPSF
ncbi:MAG: peptidylprolyl isomerase [Actinomycetota bacterium]|nr:peptidylprolyl isomerase [Actinomycetota bacterium]